MDNPIEIFRQTAKDTAAADAGEHLNNILLVHKKQPILLMLSGGSALEILGYLSPSVLGENITVSMLDERFSHNANINNFAQMQKLDFYHAALDAECSFFGTLPRKDETMEELAARWESNLENWYAENPNGLIVATLGMGSDGHTAGMFPYPEDGKKFNALFNSESWIAAYNAAGKHENPERLTATLSFFKLIDFGIALVCGAEKKAKLDELISNKGKINQLPALAWQEIGEVKIFTDIQK